MTKPQSSKNNGKIAIIVISAFSILALILISGGFAAYNFIILPSNIAASHNKNIDLHNPLIDSITKLNKETNVGISEAIAFVGKDQTGAEDIAKNAQAQENLKNLNQKYSDLAIKISDSTTKTDLGPNNDSKNFAQITKNTLNIYSKEIISYTNYTSSFACTLESTNGLIAKASQSSTNLRGLNTANTSQEISVAISLIETKYREFNEILLSFNNCFVSEKEIFKTPDFDLNLKALSKSVDNFVMLFTSIRQAIIANDSGKVNTLSNNITPIVDDFAKSNATFIDRLISTLKKFTDSAFASDKNITDANNNFLNKSKELKNKYNIG